jgi:predicted DNA binding protein
MLDRNESRGYVGGGHFNARLTDEQADELRRRYAAGGITQKALAAEYGISQPTTSEIIRRVSYNLPPT